MGKLFKELKQGLQEILAHMQGKLTLKSESIEVPERPKEHKKIRNRSSGCCRKSK